MTIFYWVPWAPVPQGGIKQAFRHVQALVDAGRDASVLMGDPRVQTWFPSRAPVAHLRTHPFSLIASRLGRRVNSVAWLGAPVAPVVQLAGGRRRRLSSDDYIVMPEFYGGMLPACGFGSRMVIFNQGAQCTYNFCAPDSPAPVSLDVRRLVGLIGVSELIRDCVAYVAPDLPIFLTPNGVDTARFHPGEAKRRQIAYMPRKLPGTVTQVLQMVRARGALRDWTLCPIDGVGEDEVARRLRGSAVFLSTCHDEGFGLPPLEAGACGCIVVGYTGIAARQFMRPEFCHPVPQGDILAFAQTLERVLRQYDADPAPLLAQARAFAAHVHDSYSLARESEAVVAVWDELIRRGAAAVDRIDAPALPALATATREAGTARAAVA